MSQVTFKLLTGKEVQLELNPELTVDDYMELLSSKEGIPKDTMAFIYNRKRLQGNLNLEKIYSAKRG